MEIKNCPLKIKPLNFNQSFAIISVSAQGCVTRVHIIEISLSCTPEHTSKNFTNLQIFLECKILQKDKCRSIETA